MDRPPPAIDYHQVGGSLRCRLPGSHIRRYHALQGALNMSHGKIMAWLMDGMSEQISAVISAHHGQDEEGDVMAFEGPDDFGWINNEHLADEEDLGTFGLIAQPFCGAPSSVPNDDDSNFDMASPSHDEQVHSYSNTCVFDRIQSGREDAEHIPDSNIELEDCSMMSDSQMSNEDGPICLLDVADPTTFGLDDMVFMDSGFEEAPTQASTSSEQIEVDCRLDYEYEPSSQETESDPESLVEYAFWQKSKVHEFFQEFCVNCRIEGCDGKYSVEDIVTHHQLWILKLKCPTGHAQSFMTGENELYRGVPAITGLIYHSALSAGLTHNMISELFSHIQIHVPRNTHWFRFQNGAQRDIGWIGAVLQVWDNKKQRLQRGLAERDGSTPLILYVDCRWDSSRSGYHGTVPVIDVATGKIVELVTIDRVEAGNSGAIEALGVRRALEHLQNVGITINEVVHDDNNTIDNIIYEFNIDNQKDLWHKCKNLLKQFNKELANVKEIAPAYGIDGATSLEELGRFTVRVLSDWCTNQNLRHTGNKTELVYRIGRHRGLPEEDITLRTRRQLKYLELTEKQLGDKLKSWFYYCCCNAKERGNDDAAMLAREIITAADHWAGNHEPCKSFLPRKCCEEGAIYSPYYVAGGATHRALKQWLHKNVTAVNVRFYTRARANFLSETFHGNVNKYAMKRIHFSMTHEARMACAAMCWNENIGREVVRVRTRQPSNTCTRQRPSRVHDLVPRSIRWKKDVARIIFERGVDYDS